MNIGGKVVNININHSFKLNDQLSFTAEITAFLGINIKEDGSKENYIDIDIVDYSNIQFMGMKVGDGYDAFKAFKQNFFNMGIDIQSQMNEMINKWIETEVTVEKFPYVYKFLESF